MRRSQHAVVSKRWVDANREKRNAQSRAYTRHHPGRRKRTRDEAWAKIRADPERYAKFLAQGRESYARHPETSYLYALNWRGENRERVRELSRAGSKRRSELTRGVNRREVAEYARVVRQDPCAYCDDPASAVDHIDALASGGEHAAANLTGACRSCNARKRDRPLLQFLLAVQSTAHIASRMETKP